MLWLGYIGAVLPALLIAFLVVRRLDVKPPVWISIAILGGMCVILPAFQFEKLEYLFQEEDTTKGWRLMIVAFLLVGLAEELLKGAVVFSIAYFSKEIINIKRGIIYSVLVAMGFALLENVIYAYIYPFSTIVVRSFTAVPAHAMFAIIMGYFLGISCSTPKKNWSYFLRGLLFASLLHGAYDWFILQGYYEWMTSGALLILSLGLFYSYWLVKYSRKRSAAATVESPAPSDSSPPGEINLPDDPPAAPADV